MRDDRESVNYRGPSAHSSLYTALPALITRKRTPRSLPSSRRSRRRRRAGNFASDRFAPIRGSSMRKLFARRRDEYHRQISRLLRKMLPALVERGEKTSVSHDDRVIARGKVLAKRRAPATSRGSFRVRTRIVEAKKVFTRRRDEYPDCSEKCSGYASRRTRRKGETISWRSDCCKSERTYEATHAGKLHTTTRTVGAKVMPPSSSAATNIAVKCLDRSTR